MRSAKASFSSEHIMKRKGGIITGNYAGQKCLTQQATFRAKKFISSNDSKYLDG